MMNDVSPMAAAASNGVRPPFASHLPGLCLSTALALVAIAGSRAHWLQSHGLSALVVAMVLGMAVANVFPRYLTGRYAPGIAISKQTLLRAGIVLYGMRLTFADIAQVGWSGIAIDACMLVSTCLLAILFGRLLKLERTTVLLIGAGSSICGAAAVLATAPVAKGRPEQVTVAVATVVVFGTVGTFLYPALYRLNLQWHVLPISPDAFGIYAGSTIHEVAQVVAAARLADAGAVDTAVIAKMVRVIMLAPFLLVLSLGLPHGGAARRLAVPWFALGFLGVVLLNSFLPISSQLHEQVDGFDTLLLTTAMAALGLDTRLSSFRQAGARPLLLALLLFLWLVGGGAMVNRIMPMVVGDGMFGAEY